MTMAIFANISTRCIPCNNAKIAVKLFLSTLQCQSSIHQMITKPMLIVRVSKKINIKNFATCDTTSSHHLQLRAAQKLLDELYSMVENEKVNPCIEHVNTLLNNVVLKCKAVIDAATKLNNSLPQPFTNKDIAPAKKPDHQWKFKKIANSSGRKKVFRKPRY